MKVVNTLLLASVFSVGATGLVQAQAPAPNPARPEIKPNQNKFRHRRARVANPTAKQNLFVGKPFKRTLRLEKVEDGVALVRNPGTPPPRPGTIRSPRQRRAGSVLIGPGIKDYQLKRLVGRNVTFTLRSGSRGKLFVTKYELARAK